MSRDLLTARAEAVALPFASVITAIRAVDREAAKRGEMFPQWQDEQRDDRLAVRRVIGMLEWYEKNTGCRYIDGWPSIEAALSKAA